MERRKYMASLKEGNRAEKEFAKIALKNGYKVKMASLSQNKFKHIDCEITKNGSVFKIDIKSMKRINRGDNNFVSSLIWLELQGEYSDGWLSGAANLIAFECLDTFFLVERKKLKRMVVNLIDNGIINTEEFAKSSRDALYKFYRRENKVNEVSTLIPIDLIDEIKWDEWDKNY